MNELNENTIEQSFIKQLIAQGYTYFTGSEIAPNGANPQRENFTSVILENHFKESLKHIFDL
jgi:type I restriction enzyme R subunit